MAHHPHRRAAAARAGVLKAPERYRGTVHTLHDKNITDASHTVVGHPEFDPLTRRIDERAGVRPKAPKRVPELAHPLSKSPKTKDAAYFAAYHQSMVSDTCFRHVATERQLREREQFGRRLKLLREGYTSPLTLNDYVVNCECAGACECSNGRVLGEGAFGRVILATMRDKARAAHRRDAADAGADVADGMCVVKIMMKQQIIDDHEVEHTMNERTMLFTLSSKFIIRFLDYMQDADAVYFVFNMAPCSMEKLHEMHGYRFDSKTTRFFAAQLVLAFDYLRHLDVVYRDLKPDNMVVDFEGNMKLIDFGTAKRLCDKTHRTYTFCGTQEYMAPELLTHRGYSFEVDWWAIGVVVYEFLVGETPFKKNESDLDIIRRITFVKYSFPKAVTLSAEEMLFIGMLLQHDPHNRLGAVATGGVDRVMKEPYFAGIDFDALHEGYIPSPVRERCAAWKAGGAAGNFPAEADARRRPPNGWNDYVRGPDEEDPFHGAFDKF